MQMDSSIEPKSLWDRVVIVPFIDSWTVNSSDDVQLSDAPRFIPRLY